MNKNYIFSAYPSLLLAADGKITNPVLSPSLQDKTGVEFFHDLLPRIIGLVFIIGVLVFFFVFLFGAIQWISSGGDKATVEQARGRIVNAIIGLVLLFVTIALIKIIESIFGVNILQINLGPLIIN